MWIYFRINIFENKQKRTKIDESEGGKKIQIKNGIGDTR